MGVDVAVVGAGPAGACAALRLANRGARVLLIDPSHPREKPCGGGVTGRALAMVADALEAHHVPAVIIKTARFVDSARGASAAVPLAAPASELPPDLLVASRADFDGALLAAARAAGAQILPARVVDLVAERGGFRIETAAGSRRSARIIGADGANSLVRRRLAHPFRRDQLSIATGYFAHGVTSDEIVIELVADPPGYLWSFPRPDHLAIGICGQADAGITAGALRARVLDWIGRTGIAAGARLEPYSWPIPSLAPGDFDTLAVSGPGWCLAGDAAGLVDPITREGIYFALQSGQWAADALATDAGAPSRAYAERVRDEIGAELTRAARFKAGFFRPAFTSLTIQALQQSAGIRAVMADLVAGRQNYASLKRRLVATCEWRLAARALLAILGRSAGLRHVN
jgi:geranylgeranyl reductase family protein